MSESGCKADTLVGEVRALLDMYEAEDDDKAKAEAEAAAGAEAEVEAEAETEAQADTEAEAEVYVLSKEEGGRHTPFFNGYKPQFYIRTTDVTGEIQLPDGVEMIMPGDNVEMKVKLITPVALDEQLRFAVREGGRTVGSGVITKVLE